MMWNRFVRCLVLGSMMSLSGAPIAFGQDTRELSSSPVPEGTAQYEFYQANLERIAQFMRDMQSHLDRTAFDFDALLESLDYDADKIINFSSTAIAFEQYPGVLRGPLGTLFSRSGNSIDQALFLAKLLRDAGYDARIAGAHLTTDEARAVLRAMQQPLIPAPPLGDAAGLLGVMKSYNLIGSQVGPEQREAYSDYVKASPLAASTGIYESVLKTSESIAAHLRAADVFPDGSAAQSELAEEARQYFWVQYKNTAASPWIDVHPVFAGALPFDKPVASSYISSEVPEELQHRLRFQVFIERKVRDRLEVLPVTAAWERPVPNLIGVPLTVSNIADSMLSVDAFGRDLATLLGTARSFVPAFGAGIADGASFFDMRGVLIDPMAATDNAAGLFATISDAFGDAVGQIGDEDAIPALTAQWIEFTLISPDGTESAFRRMTFDRIGASAREQNKVPSGLGPTLSKDARTLMQRHTFMIAAGQIPRGYVIESALERFERALPGIEAVMEKRLGTPPRARSLAEVPVDWAGHLGLFLIFDMANTIGPYHRNYRSGPALVVHSDGLGREKMRSESIDIVSNPRRVVDIRPDVPKIDPLFAVQSGVWETSVEGSMLAGLDRMNTASVFAAAEEAGAKPVVLFPGQFEGLDSLSADTQVAIRADIASGYAVIVPGTEMSSEHAGWWRVDLTTGETLGRIADGRGGEFAETLISMGISFAAFTYGAVGCQESSNEAAALCCHATNAGMALFTVGIGIGLKGALGTAIGAVLDLNRVVASYPVGAVCEAIAN